MFSRLNFFPNAESSNEPPIDLQSFLARFPKQEFWRFFVERSRYDIRPFVYRELYHKLVGNKKFVPLSIIKEFIKNQNLSMHHLDSIRDHYVEEIIRLFKATDKSDELVVDVIEGDGYEPAWINFEQSEPGYLKHVTEGFCFILDNLDSPAPLNNDFIKRLHEMCTKGVENMIDQIPGQFRNGNAVWGMTANFDSISGLTESITYLKLLEKQYQIPGVRLVIVIGNGALQIIDTFADRGPEELAKECMEYIEHGTTIYYETRDVKLNEEFLNKVTERLINDFNDSLSRAESELDKLKAIFTFIKYSVLHHPFTDGVGRTYSMILLQYLLMKENLSPFLIENSNIIPGFSVDEMISVYLNGRAEMKMILNDPSYINSINFFEPNISTEETLEKAPEELKAVFLECQVMWSEHVTECLERMNLQSTLGAR
ncbi:ankyrin repeat-containing protein [Legionella moravica]|uniref:Ankyrin repeat-containing protein n=1 Tax=Legionella moravica TaxID=39962 RepID=A0A378JVJ2_9GAMM|nr:hypothetical protein [Legionella moravica]KTD32361.1 ankyrin repeat-containing protein [Legionella moravica]STX62456.1 ankyrin repeat-containing protein [Legionella moravica]